MKNMRNCGNNVPYPIYPQPMMQPVMGVQMPYQNYQYSPNMNNQTEQQINNLSNQLSNLERRVSNLENSLGNYSNYNTSNYQIM